MNSFNEPLPQLFKGIALFTPGGDLFYCIDPHKQNRWHIQLCASIQERLGLPDPPHFLLPCYTATIDRWFDPQTQDVKVFAEAYPPAWRYRVLLNAVFDTDDRIWRMSPETSKSCDPLLVSTYRTSWPQLWENHDLVVRVESPLSARRQLQETDTLGEAAVEVRGYVLHLFISGRSVAVEQTLLSLHQLLDRHLGQPYTLKVIDILKHPEQAEAERVSATPTLIRVWPHPIRRIVGELDSESKILSLLNSLKA
ncbi:MAG: circadian clock KaiB family protein [Cyanobacteriota bacterium]|nr:circadian clock KaiB family protein [Cyanobacteriota bacterium]